MYFTREKKNKTVFGNDSEQQFVNMLMCKNIDQTRSNKYYIREY